MGNRIAATGAGAGDEVPSRFNTRRRYQQHKREYCLQSEYRSKTLPARHPHHDHDHEHGHGHGQTPQEPRLGSSSCLGGGGGGPNASNAAPPHNGETSRVLFLLYLIHRTWNVVMDTMDTRTKSRSPRSSSPQKEETIPMEEQRRPMDEECSIGITDMDASSYCSQYSCCSCSYCDEETAGTQTNVYSSIADDYSLDSMFEEGKSLAEERHHRLLKEYSLMEGREPSQYFQYFVNKSRNIIMSLSLLKCVHPRPENYNGSNDYGIFQINNYYWGAPPSCRFSWSIWKYCDGSLPSINDCFKALISTPE